MGIEGQLLFIRPVVAQLVYDLNVIEVELGLVFY